MVNMFPRAVLMTAGASVGRWLLHLLPRSQLGYVLYGQGDGGTGKGQRKGGEEQNRERERQTGSSHNGMSYPGWYCKITSHQAV